LERRRISQRLRRFFKRRRRTFKRLRRFFERRRRIFKRRRRAPFFTKVTKKTFPWTPPAAPLLYDECQNETRPSLHKKRKLIPYIRSGVPEAGLPRAGVLGVGCPTCARSIVGARRCVGEKNGTKVEKNTKIAHFGLFWEGQKF